MDPVRLGNAYRALRLRRGWRQADVARAISVSRQLVSKIETGQLESVQVRALHSVAGSLRASVDIALRWHGEGLDRLLDAAHAGLVEAVVDRLARAGWETIVEASYSIRGERGSIDVLGLNRPSATVLVVEVKSVVPDSQAMIHAIDRKTRLAREVAVGRGWPCRAVGRLLVVGTSSTARRRVELLSATYRSAFPDRGRRAAVWLREPAGPFSGLLFVPFATRGGARTGVTGRQRVRRPSR